MKWSIQHICINDYISIRDIPDSSQSQPTAHQANDVPMDHKNIKIVYSVLMWILSDRKYA